MTVALFAPCYVDPFYPGAAVASLRLLEALGFDVAAPAGAVCCGQPMANAGLQGSGRAAGDAYERAFADYEVVVTPSGSCTAHLRAHVLGAGARTQELRALLHDTVGVERVRQLGARWDARAGVHLGCHGLRGLGLATPCHRDHDDAGARPVGRSPGYCGVSVGRRRPPWASAGGRPGRPRELSEAGEPAVQTSGLSRRVP